MAITAPIDPLVGPTFALSGRVATMDGRGTVLAPGVVYVKAGLIAGVAAPDAPPPPGFGGIAAVDTKGTIFPGLIELHNHLSYDALSLWAVPKRYTNRDQWGGTPEYRTKISGPMKVLGSAPDLFPAVVRYVEVKCLLGGTTTSQGMELFSNAGARRFYRGVVRNVEATDDPALPNAAGKISDVQATDAAKFKARLAQGRLILHLSEGTDAAARNHFLALEIAAGDWAISSNLVGIHCVALTAADFGVMSSHGGAMVWSPLSNLLLYGQTADVAAAKREGVRVALGADWSPSGSKNLLGELKAARLASTLAGGVFSDAELVAMATSGAAAILGWQGALGSLEPGKRADLVVVAGTGGDPYGTLLQASEADLPLVVINGTPRVGTPALMTALGSKGESITVGGQPRTIDLSQPTADPVVAQLSVATATSRLHDALHNLPNLAARMGAEAPGFPPAGGAGARGDGGSGERWALALDELVDVGEQVRPRLPLRGTTTPTGPAPPGLAAAGAPVVLVPLTLDPLTVADGGSFLTAIGAEANLPPAVRDGLAGLYPNVTH